MPPAGAITAIDGRLRDTPTWMPRDKVDVVRRANDAHNRRDVDGWGRDLGNGVVLAVFTMRGRLAGSGSEVRERGAWVYEWVDGTIVRVLDYRDIDEACAAAERLARERADG
jgi:ketosteroid isomerase-like protein